MAERFLGLLQTVPNPFVNVRVDSAWAPLTVDIPSINDEAFQRCLGTLEDVRATRQSHGLLLYGLPGAGKTHLLARLRHSLYERQAGAFVYVFPVTAPERFYRHVLQALAGDMLRQPPESLGLSQMEIALARHLMAGHTAELAEIAAWWTRVRETYPRGPELLDFLRGAMEPVGEALQLDGGVVGVVLQYVARQNRPDARAWLLGRPVTDEQATRLGVSGTLDDESAASEALFTLARLAGDLSTLVLAFDQIEGLQTDRQDLAPLMSWGHGVANLLGHTRNVAVLTCAQVSFLADLEAAVGKALYQGRIAERRSSLKPLTAAEAAALVTRRLLRSEELQSVRLAHRQFVPDEALTDDAWPLKAAEIATLAVRPDLTARQLLSDCRELFEARRAELLDGGAVPPAEAPLETLEAVWERTLEEEAGRALDKIDEGVYVDGLLRVVDAAPTLGLTAERSRDRDVDLWLSQGPRRTALAVCHAEHMTALAARLRRLNERLAPGGRERLVVLRDQRLPVSSGARMTQQYLSALRERGAVIVRPPAEAYAALAAIRRLLAAAASGDLTDGGRSVAPEELKTWLAARLPEAVRGLVEAVSGGVTASDDGDLERLQGVLRELWLGELERIAEVAQLTPEAAEALAGQHPEVVGLIAGTPRLLFLHPNAMDRG